MSTLGVAIYLQHINDESQIDEYLQILNNHRIKVIFTSLLSFQKNDPNWVKLERLTAKARQFKILVYADIDGKLLQSLAINNYKSKALVNYFCNLGLNGVRCDAEIPFQKQAQMLDNKSDFQVWLNANLNLQNLEQIVVQPKFNSVQAISCFNFYPLRNTAPSLEFFNANKYASFEYGIDVAAFVSVPHAAIPWAYGSGLPSLEVHRDWPIADQIAHMVALNIDLIIVANSFLTELQWAKVGKVELKVLSLKIILAPEIATIEREIIFNKNHHLVRADLAANVIRCHDCRTNFHNQKIPNRTETAQFWPVGAVLILNDQIKNYKGELQIVTSMIKNDGLSNYVGQICEPDVIYFLSELKANRPFKFVNFND